MIKLVAGEGGREREREEPICIDMKHSKIYLISNKSMCMTVNFHLQKKKKEKSVYIQFAYMCFKIFPTGDTQTQ